MWASTSPGNWVSFVAPKNDQCLGLGSALSSSATGQLDYWQVTTRGQIRHDLYHPNASYATGETACSP